MRTDLLIAFTSFVLVLVGCARADRPMVRMDKGVTLSGYRVFEVGLTKNGTGKPLPEMILEKITKRLRLKLAEKGLTVQEQKGDETGVVVLRSTLISYDLINPGEYAVIPGFKDECIIQTESIDKTTNQVLGEFVARGTIRPGGGLAGNVTVLVSDLETRMIDMAVESIVEEIARQVGRK
jgi:hypothetical protein